MNSAAGELSGPQGALDARRLESGARKHAGLRVLTLGECASTNDEAFAALEREGAAASGIAVFTHAQRSGRGRRGRSWVSSPGRGLLFSVGLRPPRALPAPAWVAASAVAVRAAVMEVAQLTPRVKWPNDLLLGGKKFCGILAEARGKNVVLGIGVNVCQDLAVEQDAELGALATSLESAGGRGVDRTALAVALLDALDSAVGQLWRGEFAPLEREFVEGLGCIGEPVRAVIANRPVVGELLSVRFDEGATIQTVNGVETFTAETITSLSPVRLP